MRYPFLHRLPGILTGILICCLLAGCTSVPPEKPGGNDQPYLVVLGIAQDAGFPQAKCQKDCCKPVWGKPHLQKWVSCLALVDPASQTSWMFDATPDFKYQLNRLEQTAPGHGLGGIFLTHAHIGHYSGLIHLGREVMGAKAVPVFAMPRMKQFLQDNGPWSQLVSLKNIELVPLKGDSAVGLSAGIRVTPLQVPHRDEFSETVGFVIEGPRKKALFIPDIDKWEKWDRDINEEIKQVDIAFLDGSFYADGEIPGRNMSEIPHPFIEESMQRFAGLASQEKAKVNFIHFNHTNPVMAPDGAKKKEVESAGFRVAEEGQVVEL